MCSLLLFKRKHKYRSVSSKSLWETKHYQQNQENLKFRGQLMLFHITGECAYEKKLLFFTGAKKFKFGKSDFVSKSLSFWGLLVNVPVSK